MNATMKVAKICAECGREFVSYRYEKLCRCPACRLKRFTEKLRKEK